MNPTMTRSDELELRGSPDDYGISVHTSYYLAGSRYPELSVEVSGADRIIHRGP